MNKILKYSLSILPAIIVGLLIYSQTAAAPITPLYGGGTGVATATKGSLLVGPGGALSASYLQQAVGSNGTCLTASSTSSTGLTWGTCGSGGGGSGNSAWTIGNGLIYNATSTDVVLVGTSTPTTADFFIQGSGNINYFGVASTSGAVILSVDSGGGINLNPLNGVGTSNGGGISSTEGAGGTGSAGGGSVTFQTGAGGSPNGASGNFQVIIGNASGTGTPGVIKFTGGNVGIGTSTPQQPLVVVGSTTITSLGAGCVNSTASGNLYIASCGSGTPGGSSGQLQYNNSGSFGGIATGSPGSVLTATSTFPYVYFQATQSLAVANLTLGSGLSFSSGDGIGVLLGTSTQVSLGVIPIANGGTNTSTAPTIQGQLLGYDGTAAYAPTSLIAGSNITITTSTKGSITIAASGGGSGNSAWTVGNGLIYNATSTDAVLVGTSSPTTADFFIQGTGTKNPFSVASSSGLSVLQVNSNSTVGINTTTNTSIFTLQGTSGYSGNLWTLASSSGVTLLSSGINTNGVQLGINTTTGTSIINFIGNASNSTFSILNVASSTGASYFNVSPLGNVNIGTTTLAAYLGVQGLSGSVQDIFAAASSTGQVNFGITSGGWQYSSGPSVSVSSCGSGAAVSGSNSLGTIITGTSITACTLNLNPPVPAGYILSCQESDNSTGATADISSTSTTAVIFGLSTSLSTVSIWYRCGIYK